MPILLQILSILLVVVGALLCLWKAFGFLMMMLIAMVNEGLELSDRAKLNVIRDIFMFIVGCLCIWVSYAISSYLQYAAP